MIPQVNALVTDRNREQTRRICELKGWGYNPNNSPNPRVWKLQGWNRTRQPKTVIVPNGSLTPDQVWGVLEAEGVEWNPETLGIGAHPPACSGWWKYEENRAIRRCLVETNNPHDLTAAMDALIRVLETKKGETT